MIEGLDIDAASMALEDETISTEDVKKLFQGFREQATASSTRVTSLPGTEVSLVELREIKEHLQGRLNHLRATSNALVEADRDRGDV